MSLNNLEFKIGKRTIVMSYDEARELFNDLKYIFGSTGNNPTYTPPVWHTPVWPSTHEWPRNVPDIMCKSSGDIE